MADGCLEWKRDGLKIPAAVREATDDYLADQDTLAQWVDEWLDRPTRNPSSLTRSLFTNWKLWCDARNLAAGTETAFADTLKDRGYEQEKTATARGFKGIALK